MTTHKDIGAPLAPMRTPRPGEIVAGCVHLPDPLAAHYFYVEPPFRVGGVVRTFCHWLIVCDACFHEHADPDKIPIGWGGVWPADMPACHFVDMRRP